MTELERFEECLECIIGRPTAYRPFVVEGSPLDCRAFVVGINPATELEDGWWEFWKSGYGFQKDRWMKTYCAEREDRGKKCPSATRERIERLVAAAEPVRVLETNIYSIERPKPGSGIEWTTLVFDCLMRRIRPDAIVVHSSRARKYLEWRFDCELPLDRPVQVKWEGRSFWVRATPHFTRVKYEWAVELGEWIGRVCS